MEEQEEGKEEEEEEEKKEFVFFSHVEEATELLSLIRSLTINNVNLIEDKRNICLFSTPVPITTTILQSESSSNLSEWARIVIRVKIILKKYQEQPHLLDPHLNDIILPLIKEAKSLATKSKEKEKVDLHEKSSDLFDLVYVATKVRGWKTIVKFFPHEVADLEEVLSLLKDQNPNDHKTWCTRYILLLWLCILVLTPFDLNTIDSSTCGDIMTNHSHNNDISGENSSISLVMSLQEVGKSYLGGSSKVRDAGAELLARLLTRPDIIAVHMDAFLEWGMHIIMENKNQFLVTGVLQCLAAILKAGTRNELLLHAINPCNSLIQLNSTGIANSLHRKLLVKVIQRIGLTFLKPRVALWRYNRGVRSLLNVNLNTASSNLSNIHQEMENKEEKEDENEEFDIDERIEQVIESLINSLRDKDTVIRWISAKGIGRVTGRLSLSLADDIVDSLLDLFSVNEGINAWHGGCLALAELSRRGLLPPNRLQVVVPLVIRALNFDELQGSFSVGAHVRDAACYVCWSFARAYAPEIMRPHVHALASTLIALAIYDREVNCRRAAAASFQENVGRQGTFPHGIDIIQAVDYFTVGNRRDSYLNLGGKVSQFPEYRRHLLEHLLFCKLKHWDSNIRELSGEALAAFSILEEVYFFENGLHHLIRASTSQDLNERHGALLAIGEILIALHKAGTQLPEILQKGIKEIPLALKSNNVFHGRGADLTRSAICRLIECISLSLWKLSVEEMQLFQGLISDNLEHINESVQDDAVKTFRAFSFGYYSTMVSEAKDVVLSYIKKLTDDPKPNVRRGVALALGQLPRGLSIAFMSDIINSLLRCIDSKNLENGSVDASIRRNAVNGLVNSAINVGFGNDGLSIIQTKQVFNGLICGLHDYSVDNRGDVGSWVREAALVGVERLLVMSATAKYSGIFPDEDFLQSITCTLICNIAQQIMEKIDRVRLCAGGVFSRLLLSKEPQIPYFPHEEEVKSIFQKLSVDVSTVNWSESFTTFPLMVNILPLEKFRYNILLGLIVSTGGMTKSLVENSMSSFLNFFSDNPLMENSIASSFLDIFRLNQNDDRVIVPLLQTVDKLLTKSIFLNNLGFGESILKYIEKELIRCRDIPKLIAASSVLSGLLQQGDPTRKLCLGQMLRLLAHVYPRIRRQAADDLYTFLLSNGGDEEYDNALDIISETYWEGKLDQRKPKLYMLYSFFDIEKPKPISQKKTAKKKKKDELSYQSLVKEMGY